MVSFLNEPKDAIIFLKIRYKDGIHSRIETVESIYNWSHDDLQWNLRQNLLICLHSEVTFTRAIFAVISTAIFVAFAFALQLQIARANISLFNFDL